MAKTVYFINNDVSTTYDTLEEARTHVPQTGGTIYKIQKIEFEGSLKPWNYEQDPKEREKTTQYTYPKDFVEYVPAQ